MFGRDLDKGSGTGARSTHGAHGVPGVVENSTAKVTPTEVVAECPWAARFPGAVSGPWTCDSVCFLPLSGQRVVFAEIILCLRIVDP